MKLHGRSGGFRANPRWGSLLSYTYAHFCVDFACFFVLFRILKASVPDLETAALGFLIYNVLAFGLQPVAGFLSDCRPRIPIGMIGCGLVIGGLLCGLVPAPWTAMTVCAVGNACFHVSGGIDSLRFENGKMFGSGVFVSTGAIGVGLGTLLGQGGNGGFWIPLTLMATAFCLLLIFARNGEDTAACTFDCASDLPLAAVVVLAFAAIMVRSYGGGIVPMAWKTAALVLVPSGCAFLGKAIGGFLGDAFGAKRVGVTTLLLSIPFLCLGETRMELSMIGMVLFNVTMPITLCIVASKFPRNPGLAFGLTTLALLCGNLPSFFFSVSKPLVIPILIGLIAAAAVCIFFSAGNRFARYDEGERLYEDEQREKENHENKDAECSVV